MRFINKDVIKHPGLRLVLILSLALIELPANAQCSFSLFGNPVDKIVCRGSGAQLGVVTSSPAVEYQFFGALRKLGGPLDGSGGSLSVEAPVNSANSAGYYYITATQGACNASAGFNVYYGDIDDLSIYGWGGDSVAFRWAASGRAGYVKYTYSVSTESNGDNVDFSELIETFDTSVQVHDLVGGVQYYAHVRVEDAYEAPFGSGNSVDNECFSGIKWYTLPFKPCPGTASIGGITPLDPILCDGGNTTLTASGSTNFQWFHDGVSLGAAATTANLVLNQPGNYSTFITTPASCQGMVYSKYIVPTFTLAGALTGGGNYCLGSTFSLGVSKTRVDQMYEIRRNGVVVVPAFGGIGDPYTSYDGSGNALPRTDTMWFNFTMAPGVAGTYTVTTSNSGCQPVTFGNVVIGQLSSGTISPATATICIPGSQVLTATGGGTYQWKRNGTPVGTATTTPTYTATQDGTYSVDITNGSCTSPASNTSVVTASAPFGSITPGSGSICPTGSLTLTASGGTLYQWFKDGVSQGTPSASPTFIVTQTGLYSVMISIGSCSAPGTNQVAITASAAPSGTIVPASATICAGATQVLTASGGTTYEWFRNGISQGPPSASATFSATLAGNYTVIIFSGGCSGPASNSSTLTVTPLPSGSITPSSASFCAGGSQLLTASGGTSYEWYINGVSQGPPSASATFSATVNGIYSARIINNNCNANASNSVTVTVQPLPVGNITPANGSICSGGSVVLTASGGTLYQWFLDNVSQGPATASTNFTALAPGVYTVIISNGTCSGSASNSSTITTAANPTGTISPQTATICTGGSQLLTATDGTSYEWFLNGVSQGPSGPSATFNAMSAGVYSVIVSSGGCSGPASNTSTITVAALPTGSIVPAIATICVGVSQLFTASGGDEYQWFINGISQGPSAASATFNATLPGTYSVIIKNGLCTGPASNTAQLIVDPLPVGSITPSNPIICEGSSVILTATGGTAYEWFRNGVSQGPAVASSTFSVSTAGNYSVIITNGLCSAPASNTSIVSVSPIPAGSITPQIATICAGGTQVFTASGGSLYEWFLNSVSQGPASASPTFTASQPGIYSVVISNGVCSGDASNTSTLNVTPLPVGNISPVSAAVCAGSSQLLTASGGDSYQWFINGVSQGTASSSPTFTATSAGTYSVLITSGLCTGPAANTSLITITPLPTGAISPANPVICTGGSQVLTATGGNSYEWFLNNVSQGPSSSSSIFNATAAGTYSVIITAGQCSGPATNESVLTITPPPQGTITPVSATICAGTRQLLTATGGSSYQWFINGVSQGPSSAVATFNASVAGTYSVIITSNSCTGPASNTSLINVTPLPTGTITPAIAAVCAGSNQILTATGGTSYEWFRNGISQGASGPSAMYSATLAGTYSVIITNNNCSGPALNTAIISINPLPTGTVSPVLSTICPGATQQLNVNGGVSYQWFHDATLIPGATLSTHDASNAGVYTVQITDANGCRNMTSNFSTVNFYNKPLASFNNNISCQDQPITFINTSSSVNSGGVSYQWNFGENTTSTQVTPVHTYTQAGTFTVTLIATSAICPLLADTIKVPVVINPAIPGIKYPPARVVKNVPALISARNIGQQYAWQPPGGLNNPNVRSPMVTITDDMVYRIRITSAGGCITVDTLEVQAFSKAEVYVPKAFTPNGNNANDLLRPILVNVPVVHFFRVYNRWGQLVYQTQTPGEGWNGIYKNTFQPMETYTWVFEGKDLDGNIIKLNGKTLLIR